MVTVHVCAAHYKTAFCPQSVFMSSYDSQVKVDYVAKLNGPIGIYNRGVVCNL
jgi:hypothetical protein